MSEDNYGGPLKPAAFQVRPSGRRHQMGFSFRPPERRVWKVRELGRFGPFATLSANTLTRGWKVRSRISVRPIPAIFISR